jgi:hypothetical protein
MPPRLALAVHVGHLAREAAREPVAQAVEPVGLGGGGDARKLEAQGAGLPLDALFQCCRAWPAQR